MIENLTPLQFNVSSTIGITTNPKTQWLFPQFKLNSLCIQSTPRSPFTTDGNQTLTINNAVNLVRRDVTHGESHLVGDEEILHILRPTKAQFIAGRFQPDYKSLNWVPIKAKELNLSEYAMIHPVDYEDSTQDQLIRELVFVKDIDQLVYNKPNVFLYPYTFSPQRDLMQCSYSVFGGDFLDNEGKPWDDLNEDDLETANSLLEEYKTIISDADIDLVKGLFLQINDGSDVYIQVEGETSYQKVKLDHLIEMGARYYEELGLYYIPPKLKLLGVVDMARWRKHISLNVQSIEILTLLFPKAVIIESDSFDTATVEDVLKDHQGLVIWVLASQNTAFYFKLDYRLKLEHIDKIVKESRDFAEELGDD